MGAKKIKVLRTSEEKQEFTRHLLNDLKALETMMREGMIEHGIKRIGAEQEINFVDEAWRPAPIVMDVLQKLKNNDNLTTEYSQFNLEINVKPYKFSGRCLTNIKKDLNREINRIRKVVNESGAEVCLTGILPTIRKSDVSPKALTPEPRFQALFDLVQEVRGKVYEYNIKGIDELISRDNPLVFGGCITSLQVHLQVNMDEVVEKFNWSQAIAGPVLAMATNSPMFLGKRLWHETRIALFQQSSDTRKPYDNNKEEEARVSFGNDWVKSSILELYQEDIARYRMFLGTDIEESSLEMLEKGQIPSLHALNFFNGTVYKWNRACYGVTNGKPHLRIENRILPAGPTIDDEIANAAFWLGLMNGQPAKYQNISEKMNFADVKGNFQKAARLGLEVQFTWLNGKSIPAQELILKELMPIAEQGLRDAKVNEDDIKNYLGIIKERVKTGRTGSQWLLNSYSAIVKEGTPDEATVAVTAGMVNREKKNKPVHEWEYATIKEAGNWKNRFWQLDQVMTTNLYTVQEDDMLNLATHIMQWKKIGHVPVEDKQGHLVGLITKDSLLSHLVNHADTAIDSISIKDIMVQDLITVRPETSITDAIKLILENKITCLPVVNKRKLLGIVTEHDFVTISRHLLKELLNREKSSNGKSV